MHALSHRAEPRPPNGRVLRLDGGMGVTTRRMAAAARRIHAGAVVAAPSSSPYFHRGDGDHESGRGDADGGGPDVVDACRAAFARGGIETCKRTRLVDPSGCRGGTNKVRRGGGDQRRRRHVKLGDDSRSTDSSIESSSTASRGGAENNDSAGEEEEALDQHRHHLHPPSIEQRRVLDAVKAGHNVLVDAVAGSGKTTCNLHIAQSCPDKRVLLLTYNARLKLETRQRTLALGLRNLEVHSLHSFCTTYYDRACYTDAAMKRLLDEVGEVPLKPKWAAGKASARNGGRPGGRYDIVIVDEAQDITPLYHRLVCRIIFDNGGRNQMVVMGDQYQSIYTFNGADPRYLTMAPHLYMAAEPTATWTRCTLLQTFRVPAAVADFINRRCLGTKRLRVAAGRGTSGAVTIVNQDPFQWCRYVVKEVRRLFDRGYTPGDVFILAPSVRGRGGGNRNPLALIENALKAHFKGLNVFVPVSDDSRLDADVVRDKLTITTFHQSKGLERSVVFATCFDAGYFEFYARDAPRDRCPNTMYVAMTRTMDRLYLLKTVDNAPLDFFVAGDGDDNNDAGNGRYTLVGAPITQSGRGGRHGSKRRPAMNKTSGGGCQIARDVTSTTRNATLDDVEHVMPFLRVERIPGTGRRGGVINVPHKVRQSRSGSFEEVSEITGTALPYLVEIETERRRCSWGHDDDDDAFSDGGGNVDVGGRRQQRPTRLAVMGELQKRSEWVHCMGDGDEDAAAAGRGYAHLIESTPQVLKAHVKADLARGRLPPSLERLRLPRDDGEVGVFLRLVNLMCTLKSGYVFKYLQVDAYDWLSVAAMRACTRRLAAFVVANVSRQRAEAASHRARALTRRLLPEDEPGSKTPARGRPHNDEADGEHDSDASDVDDQPGEALAIAQSDDIFDTMSALMEDGGLAWERWSTVDGAASVCGYVDLTDDVSNTVYEFKCVKELCDQHVLQLAMYMYLHACDATDYRGDEAARPVVTGILYNVFDDTALKVTPRNSVADLHEVAAYLSTHRAAQRSSDSEFIATCRSHHHSS